MVTINKDFLVTGSITTLMVSEVINAANESNIGAHSIFLGQIRSDIINNQCVTGIEYSAYPEMVEAEMQKITSIVTEKYNDVIKIHVLHSIGLVNCGEISLLVFVGCGHRKQSFKAVEEIVELIKERLPVWKKEFLEDNSHNWPDNKTDR